MSDNVQFVPTPAHSLSDPDTKVKARDAFDIDVDMIIPAFSKASDYVPKPDPSYQFDHDTTPERRFQQAVTGRTGIDCFDYWSTELQNTNYLHNHARMWFASIWIFTLGLPWQSGAKFFMEHLFDGDAASNTLGWRWVAGVQTVGKHYLARSDNIARYTNGRFGDDVLNEDAESCTDNTIHTAMPIDPAGGMTSRFETLIVFDTDLHLESENAYSNYESVLVLCLDNYERNIALSLPVLAFKRKLIANFIMHCPNAKVFEVADIVAMEGAQKGVDVVYPFVGENLDYLKRLVAQTNLTLHIRKRPEDIHCWQYSKKGFFNFKKNIPNIIETLGLKT